MVTDLSFLERLSKNIGLFGGRNCEVVIHDFRTNCDTTIVNIVNGHVTGRVEGGPPTNLFFETSAISKNGVYEDIPLYYTRLSDGRIIKSCTTFICDENGRAAGALCINQDVSADIKNASDQRTDPQEATPRNELYAKDITDILQHYVQQAETQVGKPAAEMKRADKMRALAFLDERGIFQITKAGTYLCEYFHISKFTLYNYLNAIRGKKGDEGTV